MELNNFESINIRLASSEKMKEWSYGEVKKPETINYRTLKPERDGLFCERIFGPMKDWECHCGKYKRIRFKGVICDRCGVEVTKSKVRRERMGHIELAAPVSHIWYFKGIPSRMGLILDMSPRALEKVLYFASYVVLDPKESPMFKKQILSETEYRQALDKGYEFEAGMGAEAIKTLLEEIDLDALQKELKDELANVSGQKRVRTVKRLEVVEAFRKSGNKPEWMVIDVVPVIPPELRPMVQLDGGRFATSDLNDLYRRVINRNNRLKKLLDLHAPNIIIRNEKRMLQEAVDSLIDNGRRGRPVTGPGNRQLKSLSDMLKGKQGRFRQNLLGKRVDYSGRSVIVVGPELKMYQCGLPKEMALELFKPFIMKKLVEDNYAHNIKSAKRMVERVQPQVWDELDDIIKDHPVLLNRAPTLHRLGIQAFEPVLVEGRAIKLHPLVCTAYNADFDGDQMAAHVPLSVEAQAEARYLMLAANNLLAPKDGKPITVPSQDMVMGCYYLTFERDKDHPVKGEGKVFMSPEEALMAYQAGEVHLHANVGIRYTKEINGEKVTKIIKTTVGRWIFNEAIPQDPRLGLRVHERETPLDLEIDFVVGKKQLGKIIDRCIKVFGTSETANILDNIKALGFKYSTKGAITVSVSDMEVPEIKAQYIKEAEDKIDSITKKYRRGLITDEERYKAVITEWSDTTEKVKDALEENLDNLNPIKMMATSGARGNIGQIRQLCGMRGLMADTQGRTVERPIKASFREGLDVLEYFISTHGARKGLADTALRTADSGYLTRRLVDVSQEVIVREEDCGTDRYIVLTAIKEAGQTIVTLNERLNGRFVAEDVVHPETGELLAAANTMVDSDQADAIVAAGYDKVKVRSVLTCECKHGVCAKCYGSSLATNKDVQVGESIGIIAAQSIGEPGTQLTMRTFHTGGVAGLDDITQGLPRVEELFEARRPKRCAIISEIGGKVSFEEDRGKRIIKVDNKEDERSYEIPYDAKIRVSDGDEIEKGDMLTEGAIYPQDLIRVKGEDGVTEYLVKEVQKEYRQQGVDINDRHIEVIVRQMVKKIKIEESGDTDFLPNSLVDYLEFEDVNRKMLEEGKAPAEGDRVLLGITKASLATESFLSAASFQETTRVLTEAAIRGKSDSLLGLKENVIIGKLIPAGTGMQMYRDTGIDINVDVDEILKAREREARAMEMDAVIEDNEPVDMSGEFDNIDFNQSSIDVDSIIEEIAEESTDEV